MTAGPNQRSAHSLWPIALGPHGRMGRDDPSPRPPYYSEAMPDQPDRKQINFTIVPDEQPGEPRTYANFCSIAHTPFDFTLTFCEVMPLSEKELRDAEKDH